MIKTKCNRCGVVSYDPEPIEVCPACTGNDFTITADACPQFEAKETEKKDEKPAEME